MNKRTLLIACVLLAGGGLAWVGLNWFAERKATTPAFSDKELALVAARVRPGAPTQPAVVPEEPLPPSRAVRLAIGWLGLKNAAQNEEVAELLAAELGNDKGLELVDRQSLRTVLNELELSLSGLVRAGDAVRVGKLLRADWFLLGSTAPSGAGAAVVARIVDARTGVMRDVAIFPGAASSLEFAAKLGGFVRDCRHPVAGAKPRVFLAVGTFQDLSVNNRQAEFPAQLRAQLIQAYQGSGVTLLEREYLNALLQEVRLDLAGLTETSGGSLPRLQSAFWLVDGYYQSYETSGFQVELGLSIQRIFGRRTSVVVLDKPGEPLVRKVKAEIDAVLASPTAVAVPTRVSEAGAQMAAGKELSMPKTPGWGRGWDTTWLISALSSVDNQQLPRERRNQEEAIRAFQTVLLLEPTNRTAKMYLAAALRSYAIDRQDEARQIYRELLDEPVQDRWVTIAQQALNASLRDATAEERLRWLQPVGLQATNPSAAFFQAESRRVARDAAIQSGDGPKSRELAETRLLETISTFDAGRFYQESIGMDDFVATYGADRAAAARRLVELYPTMKARAPSSAPYLLAAVVTFQVDTNAPVIGEFTNALSGWVAHPETISNKVVTFWDHLSSVERWARENKLEALSAWLVEAKQRAAGGKFVRDEDKMKMAYAYKKAQRWRDALSIFESYTNQPIWMGNDGPWGRAFTMVFTSKEADACRKQLGLPVAPDPREFDFGKSVLCLHTGVDRRYSSIWLTKFGAVAAEVDGLWIAHCGKLMHLDFNLRTNLVVSLPVPSTTPITCLALAPAGIWIGTAGDGLIGCDRATQACTLLTEKDGLLMNDIAALHAAGDALWIGYGHGSAGGLGKLDLRTRRTVSFTPLLTAVRAETGKAPRVPVVSLASGREDDLWFIARYELGRYRIGSDQWEYPDDWKRSAVLASNGQNLFLGNGPGMHRSDQPSGLGANTLSFTDGKWKVFPSVRGLPNDQVTALAVDGNNLWVGGNAFVAQVEPDQGKLLRFAYVQDRTVDQIAIGGGYVWAQLGWHLYKAPLSASR
jgi:hypothetical protein